MENKNEKNMILSQYSITLTTHEFIVLGFFDS